MTAVPAPSRLLTSLNGDGRYGLALACVLALLLLPSLAGEVGRLAWRYERTGVAAGEFWRLASAHWVHLDLRHALLNGAGCALVWALFARDYRPVHWLAIVGVSMLAIDAGLWFGAPGIEWYVGASGWLHGVMAAGALAQLRRRERVGCIVALVLAGKLLAEQYMPLPFAGDAPVVVQAHLYGAVGGLTIALCLPSRREPL
jgi:rhomboid family GlyGly-CTERM serine protease